MPITVQLLEYKVQQEKINQYLINHTSVYYSAVIRV